MQQDLAGFEVPQTEIEQLTGIYEALQIGLRVQETMRTYGKAILKEAQEKTAGIESIEKS
jgi:hypothetical protein